jgi:hypothetical protein
MTRPPPYLLDETTLRSLLTTLPLVQPLDALIALLRAPAAGSAHQHLADVAHARAALEHALAGLVGSADPLAEAARTLLATPDDGVAAAIARARDAALRRGLPPPIVGPADAGPRRAALAARPWVGDAIDGCPRGWLPLLERAVAMAEPLIPAASLDHIKTLQIKEKFGTLRWYFRTAPVGLDGVLRLAERTSLCCCQACGAPGELRMRHGWWATLCAEHRASR